MVHCTLRWIAVLALGLICACIQELDPDASSGGGDSGDDSEVLLDTPPIDLPGGGTTDDPCEVTTAQAMEILDTTCGSCHGGGSPGARQGQPPFDYVLDVDKLIAARSESVPDPDDPSLGMRFLIPGDPEGSRLYARIVAGEMPPDVPVGLPEIPLPTVSDMSVLYTWINSCVQ